MLKVSKDWKDYEILDAGNGEKLERWGDVILRRPEPQCIWEVENYEHWKNIDGHYFRSSKGGGLSGRKGGDHGRQKRPDRADHGLHPGKKSVYQLSDLHDHPFLPWLPGGAGLGQRSGELHCQDGV